MTLTPTSAPAPTSYDELPYESNPFLWTHPDRLATVGLLFGMEPTPIERCRVLELGCASGGNLIPMALNLPDSQFVGIDLSPRQVEDGQRLVTALGLKNIELRPLSILDLDESFGVFDYIVCHGVWSWVPAPVRDGIMSALGRLLAPQGIGYVSYNANPGSQIRQLLHDILLYHVRRFNDPHQQVQQARALLDFLTKAIPANPTNAYPMILKQAADVFRQKSDSYLLHEYLEDVNDPIYLFDFVARAEEKGLQYLADARQPFYRRGSLPADIEKTLDQVATSTLDREQYLDFLRNQSFRRTMLCRKEVALSAAPKLDVIPRLQMASAAQPTTPKPNPDTKATEQFRSTEGVSVATSDPIPKAVLWQLFESYPRSLSYAELQEGVQRRMNLTQEPDLTRFVLDCFLAGVLELRVAAPACVTQVTERPTASPLAREQVRYTARVTNLRHEMIDLQDMDRKLLPLLDGSRDRAALAESLSPVVASGGLMLTHKGVPLTNAVEAKQALPAFIEPRLQQYARWSLLLA